MLRININCVRSSVGKSFSLFFFVADFLIGEEYKRALVFQKSGVCVSIPVERLARQTKPIARDSFVDKVFFLLLIYVLFVPFSPIEELNVFTISLFRLLCSFRFTCLSIECNCSESLFGQRRCGQTGTNCSNETETKYDKWTIFAYDFAELSSKIKFCV